MLCARIDASLSSRDRLEDKHLVCGSWGRRASRSRDSADRKGIGRRGGSSRQGTIVRCFGKGRERIGAPTCVSAARIASTVAHHCLVVRGSGSISALAGRAHPGTASGGERNET